MSKEKTVGGTLLKIGIGVVLAIVLIVVALYLITKYAIGVDILGVYSSLKELGTTVNTETIITYPYEKNDAMVNGLNNIFELKTGETGIVSGGDGSVTIDYERLESLFFDSDFELTDKQVACILDASINKYASSEDEISSIFNGLELCQIKFSEYQESGGKFKSVKINYVVKIPLENIKSFMNTFPLNLFKDKLPDDLYVSSDILLTKDNTTAWKYSLKSSNTTVNNLNAEKTNKMIESISGLLGVNDADEFGLAIGEFIIDAVIGTPSKLGLGSGLLNAEDFTFKRANNTTYYVVKFNI